MRFICRSISYSAAKLSKANLRPYLETNAAIVSLQIKDLYLAELSI